MKRITIHLSGVKQILTEKKVKNDNNGYDYVKKKICINTITKKVFNDEDGITFMNNYIERHRGQKVTKYYFTNIK